MGRQTSRVTLPLSLSATFLFFTLMAPTLRSSPATRTTRNSTKTPVSTPERALTPSKPRYCATCKRPRKGHPREGCPFADDVAEEEGEDDVAQNEPQADSPSRNVADALDALNLAMGDGDGDTAPEDEGHRRPKKERKPFTRMPGTLVTPTPSFMYSQSSQASSSAYKDESPPYLGLSQVTEVDENMSRECPPMDTQDHVVTPLAPTRSLTLDERASFTSSLAHLTKAAVYVLSTPDVSPVCKSAASHGLFTCTLPFDHADMFVVVGHTEAAVEVLRYQVEAKMHSLVPKPARTKKLSETAKAAVFAAVGAVVVWGTLAFT
ncbi:hypothetical protein FB45DRAFT_921034 [Roridomyces roridus]|uniref:Transmembrane protein n=1 Tax=Roridomyces roridus TaxID=1738132 RepID=A0AAD7BQP2_9AGAR|nr:hypothetical protein FB45DRAFT_921034 [Roridomyces roridus]